MRVEPADLDSVRLERAELRELVPQLLDSKRSVRRRATVVFPTPAAREEQDRAVLH